MSSSSMDKRDKWIGIRIEWDLKSVSFQTKLGRKNEFMLERQSNLQFWICHIPMLLLSIKCIYARNNETNKNNCPIKSILDQFIIDSSSAESRGNEIQSSK